MTQNGFVRILANPRHLATATYRPAELLRGYLATCDAGIPLNAVVGGARDTIAVIARGDSEE